MKDPRGGHNKKSLADHKRDGTWRASRHEDPEIWNRDPEEFRAELRDSDRPKKLVDEFVNGVMDGTIPSGRLMKLAVRRYLWDLEEGGKRGLYLDKARATEACEFFPVCLRHSKGKWAGKPFELSPSQAFIVWNVFGWMRKDGLRRFTRAHNECGRKWGKSECASGCALKQGTLDDPADPGAEIYLCATKEDQAKTQTFRQCCRMVKRSPFLLSRMKVQMKQMFVKEGDYFQPDCVIRPVGSDSDTSDGFDLSGAVLDELHAYQKRHADFYERMTTAGGSREQELVWVFTTAGNDKSETWIELRDVAVRTLESVETGNPINDHIFAFIACIDEDDDPLSMDIESDEFIDVMRKANPNMPVTPKPQYIRQQAREALSSPIGRNKFLRFHANIRVSSSVQPFPSDLLAQYAAPITEAHEVSCGGFDVGRSDDFAAWGVVWDEDGVMRLRGQAYTCAERPEHLQTNQIAEWIRQGHLIEHPGNQIDFTALCDDVEKAHDEYNVQKWAMDESFARLLGQNLQERLGNDVIEGFPQTHRAYNAACRQLQKEFQAGRVSPDTDPSFLWQMRNITFAANAKDEWMPDKGIGREYKIDAGVSVLMAYSVWLFEFDGETEESVHCTPADDSEMAKLIEEWS